MRRTTREERELFHAALSGQLPMKKAAPPPARPAAEKRQSQKAGVDGHTAMRLARGAIPPQCKLDLHGLTEAAAHRALSSFLHAAHRRGDRLALVVTGKSGVLKTMVPRWLEEPSFARAIADKRFAHRRHGGDGALYIYLRKR